MAKREEPKEYRALVGMDYMTGEGEDEENVRVEAGDKLENIPDNDWLQAQINKGIVEEWVSGHTENVFGDGEFTISGVLSSHANNDEDIVLKEIRNA